MAVDRMLRAEMRESEKVNSWPYPLRYFWTQLWGYCDDWGRGRRDPRLVKSGVMPLDDEASFEVVDRWMSGLESAGVIQCYTVDGKVYFECVNWGDSQELPYRRKTTIPDRSGDIPSPGKSSEKFQKDPAYIEEKGKRREGESAGAPPSPFCPRHPNGTDDPCKACGDIRRAQKNKPTPTPGRLPRKGDGHECVDDGHGWCLKCVEKVA